MMDENVRVSGRTQPLRPDLSLILNKDLKIDVCQSKSRKPKGGIRFPLADIDISEKKPPPFGGGFFLPATTLRFISKTLQNRKHEQDGSKKDYHGLVKHAAW